MSVSSSQSNLQRVERALAQLMQQDASEAKKEATLTKKMNDALAAADRSSSSSTIKSRLRDAERAQLEMAKIQEKRARIAKQLVTRRAEQHRHQASLAKEEERERKKIEKSIRKTQDQQAHRQADLNRKITQEMAAIRSEEDNSAAVSEPPEFDVFISHASEDKVDFVDGLAQELDERGVKVWYDSFTLTWGAKLRQEIERGLRSSRFGIVVLSEHFFRKEWPQDELDGLFELEQAGATRILPIWHKITKDEITRQSPIIAGRLGMNTSINSTAEIADRLMEMLGD